MRDNIMSVIHIAWLKLNFACVKQTFAFNFDRALHTGAANAANFVSIGQQESGLQSPHGDVRWHVCVLGSKCIFNTKTSNPRRFPFERWRILRSATPLSQLGINCIMFSRRTVNTACATGALRPRLSLPYKLTCFDTVRTYFVCSIHCLVHCVIMPPVCLI